MNKQRDFFMSIVTGTGFCFLVLLVLVAASSARGQVDSGEDMQVLTRGPMHEAFVSVSMSGPTAGEIIHKTPYDPIPELPPEQRPEGPNVEWIPGYWSWDEDWDDFIWVSGVWRIVPPGREWVPGYWAPAGTGVQWISGFWREINRTEVTYLPPPPEPLEVGPSSPSPGPDRIWTPGCWIWRENRYYWRPGYWIVQRPEWVWVPAHYIWTPRGYVYVAGYWDYDIARRGVIFAPVYYARPIYRRAGYVYSPRIVIDLGVITAHIFVRPRGCHYYFGDYYDYRYEQRGFYPWHHRWSIRYGDDPLYAHFRMRQLQRNPNWDTYVVEQYRYRRENAQARPPQTLAMQINIINTSRADSREGFIVGRSLTETVQSRSLPMRFTSVSAEERRQVETRGREVHRLQGERARMEASPPTTRRTRSALETARPVRAELRSSPVRARATEDMDGARVPPPEPTAPETTAPEIRGGRQGRPEQAPATTPQRGRPAPERTGPAPVERRTAPQRGRTTLEQTTPAPAERRTAPQRGRIR